MTKTQATRKTNYLISQAARHMRELIDKALRSGALDLAIYEDDYLLPKIIVSSLLREVTWQYQPLHPEDRKTSKNLDCFI